MIARWVAFNRAKPSVWPGFSVGHPMVERIGEDGASFVTSSTVAAEHHCAFWNAR
jgi:hypothetical protein